jgi:hypothetical protein
MYSDPTMPGAIKETERNVSRVYERLEDAQGFQLKATCDQREKLEQSIPPP